MSGIPTWLFAFPTIVFQSFQDVPSYLGSGLSTQRGLEPPALFPKEMLQFLLERVFELVV